MTLTQITEKGIKDGEIINADINASAAIAGSKIDPSFTSNITVSGTDPRIIFTDTNNNPDFTLHANGGERQVENSGAGTQLKLESSGATRVYGNLIANANLTVDTNTLHVDSSNNLVGVGTTSPNSNFKLDVNGAARIGNTTDGIIIENSTSNPSVSNACRIHRNGATGELNITSGTTTARNMIFNTKTSGAESMRITNDGNVGIGTTSVYGKLQIGSGLGGSNVPSGHELLFGANNSDITFLSANDGASVDGTIGAWNTVYNHQNSKIVFDKNAGNTGQLKFFTNNGTGISERMRIDHDGNTTFDPHAGGTLKISGSSAHTSKIVIADNGGTANGNCLVEGGDGSDFFTINSAGNVKFATGKGIDFANASGSASGSSSSILDDYEEGTCTPQWMPASGSFGIIYQSGHYTKIGDVVTLTGSISINGATNASGEVQITGLPFSVRSVNSTWSGEGGHGVGRWFYAGPNHYCFLVCNNSTDRIQVHKADGTFLNYTNMSTGYNQSQFSFTVTYLTDS